ncbi:MAG: nucleoside recognition domain-containing protein, partial [Alphaproteobacteria bacterium]|nr:nucleoside recognition domain-containing protein [Alphaproteobacteria bacterium]
MINASRNILFESLKLYWVLLKVMVPVMVIVEIGIRLGLVEAIAKLCAPLMKLVGLPPEMAIVLASNMLVGLYGAAAALLPLLG